LIVPLSLLLWDLLQQLAATIQRASLARARSAPTGNQFMQNLHFVEDFS